MIPAVFDTSTVGAAIFWPRSTARRCWTFVVRRKARPGVTDEIEREYRETCLELQALRFPERSPASVFELDSHEGPPLRRRPARQASQPRCFG